MTWLIYGVVALLVVVGLVAGVGAALPKDHTVTRSAHFHRGAAELFGIVTGPPDWRPDVKKYEPLAPVNGRPRWREVTSQDTILYELVEATPPHRLVTRIADDSLPYGGTWTLELTGDEASTTVRITEQGEVRNVIFRFLARYAFGYTASIETYMKNLAKKVGEELRIEQ
jgi:hypothetical protein